MSATLRELRKKAGLTQKALSEKSGVYVTLIKKYELGQIEMENMQIRTMLKLTRALGVPAESFIKSIQYDSWVEKQKKEAQRDDLTEQEIIDNRFL